MNIFKKSKLSDIKEYNLFTQDNYILGKDETLTPKLTKIFGINYNVNVYYLKIKTPELNLESSCININLPMNYRFKNNQQLLDVILLKMYTKIAENEIENLMEQARHEFGFAPEDYFIEKMPGTLGHCNQDLQAITINPYIVMYPKEVIEYIVYHEFCHLKYRSHSKKFYSMLKGYIPNYLNIAKQIPNLKY